MAEAATLECGLALVPIIILMRNDDDDTAGFLIMMFSCPSSSRPTLEIDCSVILAVLDKKPSRPNGNHEKLMGVMRKHELTNKKTTTKTNT